MATTNLKSKTLGLVLVQSGDGTPDHTAPRGSYYTNKTTGTTFINTDGSTGWDALNRIAYGEIYIQDNATTTTISTTNTWVALNTLTWTEGNVNGFTLSSGRLLVSTGRDGRYLVIATATLDYVAVSNYEVGISKNSGLPASGLYAGASLTSTVPTAGVSIIGHIDLVAGDTVELSVRDINNTNNVTLKHGGIILKRIGD